uniref:Uncharacterized protein n=1 Tax=Caenorhabditis japonica TaxID=281687 RepID=A0A8R1DNQ9_CAEJA
MPKKPKICDKIASTNPSNVQLLNHDKRLETSITFVRLENQHDDPEQTENWLTGNYALGYYTGIGRKFERVACGSEITLVVFGHAQAGKTTFVRAIRQLFLEGGDRIRVIPNAERYKLAGIGVMPFPEGDNRLPHIVSLVINASPEEEYVLDIIDPEYDNSNLPQAYMDSCDAAFFLIDARNCASLLSAHQIQRNLKSAEHNHVQSEMLMNIPSEESGQPRMLSAQFCETMTKKTTVREICAQRLDKNAMEEMLLSICARVHLVRRPSPPSSI